MPITHTAFDLIMAMFRLQAAAQQLDAAPEDWCWDVAFMHLVTQAKQVSETFADSETIPKSALTAILEDSTIRFLVDMIGSLTQMRDEGDSDTIPISRLNSLLQAAESTVPSKSESVFVKSLALSEVVSSTNIFVSHLPSYVQGDIDDVAPNDKTLNEFCLRLATEHLAFYPEQLALRAKAAARAAALKPLPSSEDSKPAATSTRAAALAPLLGVVGLSSSAAPTMSTFSVAPAADAADEVNQQQGDAMLEELPTAPKRARPSPQTMLEELPPAPKRVCPEAETILEADEPLPSTMDVEDEDEMEVGPPTVAEAAEQAPDADEVTSTGGADAIWVDIAVVTGNVDVSVGDPSDPDNNPLVEKGRGVLKIRQLQQTQEKRLFLCDPHSGRVVVDMVLPATMSFLKTRTSETAIYFGTLTPDDGDGPDLVWFRRQRQQISVEFKDPMKKIFKNAGVFHTEIGELVQMYY